MTNYYTRDTEKDCPECGDTDFVLRLKRESTRFKGFYLCPGCQFESRTFFGPSETEDDLYDDRKVHSLADTAAEKINSKSNL